MSGSDKEETQVMEQEAYKSGHTTKPSFGQKVKRHCARFWWLHVIIVIIIVLVVTLPIVYVGYPNIAQSEINKATLAVTAESLTNPAPDAIDLDLNSVIITDSSYHPQLDAFDGELHLEDSDTPFLSFRIPAVKADNGTKTQVKQRIQIENLDAFTEYTKATLIEEEFTIHLKGKGGLKQGGLPHTTVNYNQKIKNKGFNGLKGMNVTSFHLLNESLPDGGNAQGTVFIPNPTPISLGMGNVTLDMNVAGTFIGNATIPDLYLTPGNNTLPIHVTVNQTAVIGLLQQDQFNCGILPVDIKGKKSMYNGGELTYYTAALQANKLTNDLNVRPALEEAGFGFVLGDASKC